MFELGGKDEGGSVRDYDGTFPTFFIWLLTPFNKNVYAFMI